MNDEHKPETTFDLSELSIAGKYKIIRKIKGNSFLAEDSENNKYFLKKFVLEAYQSLKARQITEELKSLKNIELDAIPRFIESFSLESDTKIEIFLVQEYIGGKTLCQLVRESKRFTEKEAIELLIEISEILEKIHSYSPQLIHGSLCPDNILISPDSKVYLLMNGVKKYNPVKNIENDTDFVREKSYTAPEQIKGEYYPASDIYSLGLSIIYLLSHKEIFEIENKDYYNFRKYVNISDNFSLLLDKMTEADYHKRFQSISQLKEQLHALKEKSSLSLQKYDVRGLPDVLNFLQDNEKVLWVGQPKKRLKINSVIISMFILGFLLSSVSICWTLVGLSVLNIHSGILLFMPLLGIPFILAGLGLMATPYKIYDNFKNTVYAITDKRIIVRNIGKKPSLLPFTARFFSFSSVPVLLNSVLQTNKSFSRELIRNMYMESFEYKNNTGDISFYHNVNEHGRLSQPHLELLSVDNIQEVEKLIIKTFFSN